MDKQRRVELERKHVIAIVEKNNEFHQGVDGYVYYWPQNNSGHITASQLRWIADELDRRNETWDKAIETLSRPV